MYSIVKSRGQVNAGTTQVSVGQISWLVVKTKILLCVRSECGCFFDVSFCWRAERFKFLRRRSKKGVFSLEVPGPGLLVAKMMTWDGVLVTD